MLTYPLIISTQQLAPVVYPFDTFNLTDGCFKMLNTIIPECSFLLKAHLATP